MERFTALETFVRVVDTGSFTVAAKQLGISQSGASKAIARLEAELGVRLLHRSTRKLNTTEAGHRLHECAKRAIEEIDRAVDTARQEGSAIAGKLRVSAPVGFGRQHIVGHLPAFLERHPDLEVEIVLNDEAVDVTEARIDLCFHHGQPRRKIPGARRIGTAARHVVGTPAYFARYGIPATPDDLLNHYAVEQSPDRGTASWTFRRHGDVRKVELRARLKVDSSEGLRDAVLAHAGLAIVSEWDVAPELSSGALRAVLTDWRLPADDIWAVSPAGRLTTTRAKVFASFIEARMAETADAPASRL